MVSEGLNSIEGFECNAAEGRMYLFPKVDMPEKAIQEAKVSLNVVVCEYDRLSSNAFHPPPPPTHSETRHERRHSLLP